MLSNYEDIDVIQVSDYSGYSVMNVFRLSKYDVIYVGYPIVHIDIVNMHNLTAGLFLTLLWILRVVPPS